MPAVRASSRRLSVRLVAALACAGCLSLAGAVPSDPGANADPVTRLLVERGLMPPAAATPDAAPASPGFVQQVRDRASDMVLAAMNFLGVPYRRGGTSADSGFDCSGFTRHIFEMSLGLVLPRRVDDQAHAPGLSSIAKAELKPGDLVFFNTLRRTFSHVGIYIGDGKFIHAPRAGSSVRVEDMRQAYWQQRFTGARRVDFAALPAGGPAARESPPDRATPSQP
jgi:cell wall-associated NlpC family hydrolase